jgi:FAD synthase
LRARLYGRITGPVLSAIGVWDPILPGHVQLYRRLSEFARESSLSPLAIAIDPDPVRYLYGASECPVYNDVDARIAQMLSFGLAGVLRVRFLQRDIEATAADLFALLDEHIQIAELWLGARQTLGRLEGGNFETIMKLAETRRMRVNRLPLESLGTHSVRQLLRTGHIVQALELVGRPPLRMYPKSGVLRMAWCPGVYRAVPIKDPNARIDGSSLELELTRPANGLPGLVWPDKQIKCLAFVSGPGDQH